MGRTAVPDVLKIQIICLLFYGILCNFNTMSRNKFPTGCICIKLILVLYFNDIMQLYGILGQPSYVSKRQYYKWNYTKAREDFMLVDWSKLDSLEVQDSFDFICEEIKTCTENNVPVFKKNNFTIKKPKWKDKHCVIAVRKKIKHGKYIFILEPEEIIIIIVYVGIRQQKQCVLLENDMRKE